MFFKLYNDDKMKTFMYEKEAHAFAKEKGLINHVLLGISPVDFEQCDICVKDEINGWETKATVLRLATETNGWGWTEDFYSGSKEYENMNEALKDFVRTMRSRAYDGEGSPRYSIYDVYSPNELGVNVKDF